MAQDFTLLVGTKVDDTQILNQLKTISKKTSVTVKVNADTSSLETLKTVTTKGTDAMGNLVTATEKFNKSGESLGTVVTNVTQKMNNANKSVKSLAADFVDTTTKVAKFGASTAVIGVFYSAIQEAKEAILDFNSALTEFTKVSDLSDEQLSSYTDRLSEMGEEVARTRTEMLESATEFVKTGASEEDAAQLAKISEMYRNIADEQISSSDSAALLTSQMKAFNFTADESIHIIDSINQVSNEYAVSSSDVSSALTKTSSAMSVLGNSFEETIGLVTAGTEIMTGQASKVARGLRTIGNNIADTANKTGELSYSVEGATKSISLLDESTGDMKSTYQVLGDIAEDWNKMSASEQQAIAISLAGKNQFEVFGAVLSNFENAVNATNTALDSQGSATRENAAYTESLQAKIIALKGQFQELVLGDGGLTSFVKLLVDAGTTILKFANSDVGQLIIKLTLLYTTLNLLNKGWTAANIGFSSFKSAILASKDEIIKYQKALLIGSAATKTLYTDTQLLKTGILSIAKSWMTPINTITLAIGVIFALLALYDKFNVTLEEHSEKLEEATNKYNDTVSKIEEIETQLDEVNKQRVVTTDQEELDKLADKAEILQRELDIQLRLAEIEKERKEAEAVETLTDTDTFIRADESTNYMPQRVELTASGQLEDTIDKINQVKIAQDNLYKSYKEGEISLDTYNTKSEKLIQTEQELVTKGGELSQTILDATKELDISDESMKTLYDDSLSVVDAFNELTDTSEEVTDSTSDSSSGFEEASVSLEDYAEQLGITTDELINAADAIGLTVDQYAKYASEVQNISDINNELNDNLDGIQSAYKIATEALEEYNSTGAVSIDTFQSLISLSPDYLSALTNENGQISINEQTLSSLTEQLKQNAVQNLATAAAADILALANGDVDSMSQTAKDAVAELGDSAATAGAQAANAASGMLSFAGATAAAVTAMGGLQTGELPDDFEEKKQAIISSYEEIAKSIGNISIDFGGGGAGGRGGGGSKKASSAGKSAGDAYKEAFEKELDSLEHDYAMELISTEEYRDKLLELNERYFGEASGQHEKYIDEYRKYEEKIYDLDKELLDERKKAWETLFDYISDEYQNKIDSLEKTRDEETDEIQSRIDALEEKRDKEIEQYEKEREELEKNKDEIEAYWDDKINKQKEANEQLNKNIELQELLEAIERAKSQKVKVFKDGKFQLVENESEVESAEQDLSDYQEDLRQEEQLNKLEQNKQEALDRVQSEIDAIDDLIERREEYYDKSIEDLEAYLDDVEDYYETEIEIWENKKEAFEESTEAYAAEQEKQHALQIVGMEEENEIWQKRLENLQSFVDQYNALLREIDEGVESSSGDGIITDVPATPPVSSYATGTSFVKDNQIAVVGENPNKEIVIGSKVNGSLVKLNKGDGVVNSKATNTLAGVLNNMLNPNNSYFNNSYYATNSSSKNIQNFYFDKIELPNVSNGDDFVNVLSKNYKNYTIQMVNGKS